MTEKNMPQAVKKQLMSAFTERSLDDKGDWFPVWGEKAERWLFRNFPLYTGGREYFDLGFAKVFFYWTSQKWMIGTA